MDTSDEWYGQNWNSLDPHYDEYPSLSEPVPEAETLIETLIAAALQTLTEDERAVIEHSVMRNTRSVELPPGPGQKDMRWLTHDVERETGIPHQSQRKLRESALAKLERFFRESPWAQQLLRPYIDLTDGAGIETEVTVPSPLTVLLSRLGEQ